MTGSEARGPNSQASTATAVRTIVFLIVTVTMGAVITALTGLKTNLLMKDQLGLTVSQYNYLMLILGLPGYLQPFIGIWTDMFACFGYHRRSYYLAGKLIGAAGLFGLGYLELTHRIGNVSTHSPAAAVCCMLIIAAGGIMRTVIFNAILVIVGNLTGRFGQYVSIVNIIPLAMGLWVTSVLSGYVADHWSYQHAFFAGGVVTLLSTPFVFLIDEKRVNYRKHKHETEEEHQVRVADRNKNRAQLRSSARILAGNKDIWILIAFVFYLILTPGINNTKFYFERDFLHFTGENLGLLARYSSAGSLIGYGLYVLLSRRIPVFTLAWGAWLMDCLSYPFFLVLHSLRSAQVMEVAECIIGALYSVFLYTLAARMCPKGLESTVYGLVQSAIAISSSFSEIIGSRLYELFGPQNTQHHYTIQHGWNWSVYMGLLFTIPAGFLIPFLPVWTRSRKRTGELTDEDVYGTS